MVQLENSAGKNCSEADKAEEIDQALKNLDLGASMPEQTPAEFAASMVNQTCSGETVSPEEMAERLKLRSEAREEIDHLLSNKPIYVNHEELAVAVTVFANLAEDGNAPADVSRDQFESIAADVGAELSKQAPPLDSEPEPSEGRPRFFAKSNEEKAKFFAGVLEDSAERLIAQGHRPSELDLRILHPSDPDR